MTVATSKILLIENESQSLKETAELLSLSNYEVKTAANRHEGYERALDWYPDLIICQLKRPAKGGEEILYPLGKEPQTASIPFIAISDKASLEEIRKVMTRGADDFLVKPFNIMDLLNSVETRLKKRDFWRKSLHNGGIGPSSTQESKRDLLDCLDSFEERIFRKGQHIFQEGKPVKNLYYIRSGMVKTVKSNSEGKLFITSIHWKGGWLGYESIFQRTNGSVSKVVLEDSRLIVIPAKDATSLVASNPVVLQDILKDMCEDMKEKEVRMVDLAYGSVRRRVANTLVGLNEYYNRDDRNTIDLSRDDLARISGTAKETLIRMLGEFRRDGALELDGLLVRVKDPEYLRKMVC